MFGGRGNGGGEKHPQYPPMSPTGGHGSQTSLNSPSSGNSMSRVSNPLGRIVGSVHRGSSHSKVLRVCQVPSNELALTNCLLVSSRDFPGDRYVMCDDQFVLSTRVDDRIQPGTMGATGPQREWAGWALNQEVNVTQYDPFNQGSQAYLGSLTCEIGFYSRNKTSDQQFDQDQLAKWITGLYQNQLFAPGQKFVVDFRSILLKVTVTSVQIVSLQEKSDLDITPTMTSPTARGIMTAHTSMTFFKAPNSTIRLKASSKRPAANAIIAPNFKFEDMGIGGLDKEFSTIFRRAFASRVFPPALVEKLGIEHVKGILLFGPPGTGKTLIARQIGKMLNAREPKIVNGPEILSKFVGQSEENVRKLFADAEKEYREKGEESGLHIIIFDELDAICRQRGTKGDSTGVGDTVVNQLLSKMDGVDQLNNVLIIGMTNRKDMIDEALLRPGRLEVHMEISLPDEKGRRQILKIHTTKMRMNKVMAGDVDIDELAALTKNFSGAEISGLVKSATSFAFNRHIKAGTMAAVSEDIDKMQVERQDFMNAFNEVKPAFGVSEEELESCLPNGIIKFSPHINGILEEGKLFTDQVRTSEHTPLVSVLLHGPPAAGKTALAAAIGLASEFPFIKLLSATDMAGMSESSKVSHILKVFNDAYRSPLNVVVVDSIEDIIEWVPIGPRFSNAVFQTLRTLFKKHPPKGRRLLILATTSMRSVWAQMDMLETFQAEIPVPAVNNLTELDRVLQQVDIFSDDGLRGTVTRGIQQRTGSEKLGVGISHILGSIETARQDSDVAERFIDLMVGAVARRTTT